MEEMTQQAADRMAAKELGVSEADYLRAVLERQNGLIDSLKKKLEASEHWFEDVLEFMKASGRHISPTPNDQFPDRALRLRLIREEYNEFQLAVAANDLVGTADAIVDLIYVLNGAADSWGLDIREVWKEVHKANMKKFPPDGPKIVNGKIVKPDGWTPPDVVGALARGHIQG